MNREGITRVTSDSSRLRAKTGKDFESALDAMHAQYEFRKWGKIRRNWAPTKRIAKDKVISLGAADVDRSGWINAYLTGELSVGIPWTQRGGVRFPVAFDAKVLSRGHATYQHDLPLQHQLHALRASADAGEYAFLLVYAPQVERVFALSIRRHFNALVSRAGVTLWDTTGKFLQPSITRTNENGIVGWNWIPLVRHCEP